MFLTQDYKNSVIGHKFVQKCSQFNDFVKNNNYILKSAIYQTLIIPSNWINSAYKVNKKFLNISKGGLLCNFCPVFDLEKGGKQWSFLNANEKFRNIEESHYKNIILQ